MKIRINPHNIFIYIFFFSLNFETLNTFNLGIDFLITKITLSILLLLSLLKYKTYFSLLDYSKYFYPIVAYFIFLVFMSYLNRNSVSKTYFHIAVFLNLLILIILSNYSSYKKHLLLGGLFVFALSTIVISLVYYFGIESKNLAMSENVNMRGTIFDGNANDIGLKLTVSLFILIAVLFENKLGLGKFRFILLLFFPFLLKFLIDTRSRVAFIALILGLSIMGFVYLKKLQLTYKKNVLIIGSIIILFAVIFILKDNTLIIRLTNFFHKGDLSTRDEIWSKVIPIISNNLFFGVGETGYAEIMGETSPHNVFLEVLAYTGIFGLIMFLFFILRIFIAAFKQFRFHSEILPAVLIIPVLGSLLSGQIFEEKIYWVIFAYIIGNYFQHEKSGPKQVLIDERSS